MCSNPILISNFAQLRNDSISGRSDGYGGLLSLKASPCASRYLSKERNGGVWRDGRVVGLPHLVLQGMCSNLILISNFAQLRNDSISRRSDGYGGLLSLKASPCASRYLSKERNRGVRRDGRVVGLPLFAFRGIGSNPILISNFAQLRNDSICRRSGGHGDLLSPKTSPHMSRIMSYRQNRAVGSSHHSLRDMVSNPTLFSNFIELRKGPICGRLGEHVDLFSSKSSPYTSRFFRMGKTEQYSEMIEQSGEAPVPSERCIESHSPQQFC
ncbi:unnamed protein product [Angiostrongylus costaricensis]|uniref:Uncharacterized protein n=1 Tax=Angiostrongylus costaricensis TaxID=334426 RepID=A0A0R3Q0V7_ANGCS|nr:unnamed protein product [Angiostrongylus costaricensis]